MSDNTSLLGLGELTKPATVLIEKISDAIGAAFAPYQKVRLAKADAEIERIRAYARADVADIENRAIHRFLQEEVRKQENIEEVTRRAISQLHEDANPNAIENDWIANFFDKCRLTSDEDLQQLWSRILSGEANSPGRFSKRTVNFLAALTKVEAEQFTALCSFCWSMGDEIEDRVPLVFEESDQIYKTQGVSFNSIAHLESIGLLQFQSAGFQQFELEQSPVYSYFGKSVSVMLPIAVRKEINLGKVVLTRIGLELESIAGAKPCEAFFEYTLRKWRAEGYQPVIGDQPGSAG